MITARHLGVAGAVGLALGAAISVSPAGAAAVAALCAMIWWTARPLTGIERRWVLGWLTLAAAARVAVVAALPLAVNPGQQSFATLFGGDAFYMIQRSIWIANAFVHAPFAPRDFFEAFEATYGASGYNYMLALLHVFFGPSPYATHLLSVILSLASVVLLFRYVRSGFGRVAAFIGLATLTTMPSLFVWSVAPLKEAPFSLLAAAAMLAMLLLLRPRRLWQMPFGAAGVVAMLWAIRSVRPEWAILTAAALAAGAIGWGAYHYRRIAVAATVVAAIAIVALAFGASPRTNARVGNALQAAVGRHLGNASEPGHSYALLDPDSYAFGGDVPRGPRALGRFFARSTVRFLTVPEPWILKPGLELLLIPQQIMWYVILALAGAGVVTAFRRDPLLASVCAAFVVVGAVAIGVNSGNVGTLIRHRDTVVPFAVWLSAVGGAQVLGGRAGRFNRLDAGIIVLPCLLVAVGAVSYWLFHTPPPQPESVTPATVYVPGQVILRGRHLRPFLRVLVAPTGQAPETRGRHPRSPEAVYALRTTNEAQLTLPVLPPGVYDLVLYDAADEVAHVTRAFTVNRMAGDPVGVVLAEGRFIGVDPLRAALSVGDAIRSSDGLTAAEVLRVGRDEPYVESIGPGLVKTWVRIDGQVQRSATLRLRCAFTGARCLFAAQPVVADGVLALPFAAGALQFKVDDVGPDGPASSLVDGPTGEAVVDFIGWPGAQNWVHAGDSDAGVPGARSLRPTRIVRVIEAAPFVGDAVLDSPLAGERFALEAPLVRVRALVRFPRLPSGDLDARNAPVRLGSRLDFETSAYLLHGTIVSLSADGARTP